MAGTDNMLLALSGIGHFDGKSFGFASCDRKVGAAEGINVLRHRKVATVEPDGTCVDRLSNCTLVSTSAVHVSSTLVENGLMVLLPCNILAMAIVAMLMACVYIMHSIFQSSSSPFNHHRRRSTIIVIRIQPGVIRVAQARSGGSTSTASPVWSTPSLSAWVCLTPLSKAAV